MSRTSERWSADEIFCDARAYDLAFAWDVSRELDVVLAIANVRSADGPLLLPACGTGRYALALAERGFDVDGSDINDGMLAIARSRPHPRARYVNADMTRSLGDRTYAAAFTFTNSFRYILDEDDVAAHFREMHARLRSGATYVIDLGLTMGHKAHGAGARWTVRYDDCVVRATGSLVAVTPPLSLERARIVVENVDGTTNEVTSDQPQRVWSLATLTSAAEAAGFRVRAHRTNGCLAAPPVGDGRFYVALDRLGGPE